MDAHSDRPGAVHLLAIALLSAAMLAFEVLLLRLFEFSHWHHFAGFAIALALLGLGTAGSVLALLGERATRAGDRWFLGCMLATAVAFLAMLFLQSHLAVRPLFAAWDPAELARLLAIDLAAFLPFFCAGLAIGQVFPRWPRHPARLYSANLLGSAAGSLGASVLLAVMLPQAALALVTAVLALAAAGVAFAGRRLSWAAAGTALAVLATAITVWPPAPAVSDFKALSRLLDLPDARVLHMQPGLAGRLTVIRSESLRSAPGLSLQWSEAVPATDAVVIGSDRVIPMPRRFGAPPAHAGATLAGLPLRLRPDGPVLVAGSSDWGTPALAGARSLTWVEPDGRVLDLAGRRGAPASWHRVEDSPARFLAATEETFALVTLDITHGGGDAAGEDYLMTVGGLASALRALRPGGLLAIPLALDYPPRRGPRALATLRAALQRAGAVAPGDHVAVLRGLQSLLVLASPQPVSAADRMRIEAFSARWRFDTAWLPGMTAATANRYNVLPRPVFFEASRAVFAGGSMPAEALRFETAPAELGRPYFWRDMRWSQVPGMLGQQGRRALSQLDWTLVMTALSAVIAIVLAVVLVLLPLGRMPPVRAPLSRTSVAAAFAALGVGYMFTEMALFQRAILFLGEPVLAASVVFAVFLGGSGIGAAMPPRGTGRRGLATVYAGTVPGLAIVIALLWVDTGLLQVSSPALRAVLVAAALLPLTWALGRPLPWSLARLSEQPRWLPWAWGINGFASVLGISLAPLVSVHLGQGTTLAVAAGAYAVAGLLGLRWLRAGAR